jgi:hypothetical protein
VKRKDKKAPRKNGNDAGKGAFLSFLFTFSFHRSFYFVPAKKVWGGGFFWGEAPPSQ